MGNASQNMGISGLNFERSAIKRIIIERMHKGRKTMDNPWSKIKFADFERVNSEEEEGVPVRGIKVKLS